MRKQVIELMILRQVARITHKLRRVIYTPFYRAVSDYDWCKLRVKNGSYDLWRGKLIAQIKGKEV